MNFNSVENPFPTGSMKRMAGIDIEPFGLLSYTEALELQKQRHAAIVRQESPACILWGQHPSVITLGKNASLDDLHVTEQSLRVHEISLIRTDRGGKMTLHNPGQLVVYPLVDLVKRGIGVKSYVCMLEKAVIAVLRSYGISAHTDGQFPGVWVGQEKVSALGIRLHQKVSMHGLSLNICNNLEPYQYFSPCGIQAKGVTSMQKLLGPKVVLNFEEIAKAVVRELVQGGL